MKKSFDEFIAGWGKRSQQNGRKKLSLLRGLCICEIIVYAIWHPIVYFTQPSAYNPIESRLLVIAVPLFIIVGSYFSKFITKHSETLYYFSLYTLLTHHLYLSHVNYADVTWPVQNYIVVAALCACFHQTRSLRYFSIYTFIACFILTRANNFIYQFYLPGMLTMLSVMNINLYYRNHAFEQLEEAKLRFEKLFDAVFEGIAVHKEGKILATNASFAKLVGCEGEDLRGLSLLTFVAPNNLEAARERTKHTHEYRYETWLQKKDGLLFPVEISTKTHFYQGQQVRMVAIRDMSERHQIEAEKEKTHEAEAAVKLRDQFISIASHELRTPLTPIKLSNEILLRMLKTPEISALLGVHEAKFTQMLTMSVAQISRITHLIDEMLDVSRISSGYFALSLADFDLNEALDHVLSAYSEEILRRGPKLQMRGMTSISVHWDRLRTEQVLTNLLRNSLLYGNGKPISISLRVVNEKVYLSIRDHGIGISPDAVNRIFNRFERAVPSENYGGLGLGLYIVQQIVHAHQGQIHVKSTLGKGSRFTVVIPRVAATANVYFGNSQHPPQLSS